MMEGKREEGRGKKEEGRRKREEGRGKKEEGRRLGLRLLRIRRPNKNFSPIPIGLNNPVYLGCRDVR